MNFQDLILTILDSHSGGVKITELIVDVIVGLKKLHEDGTPLKEGELLVIKDDNSPFLDALNKRLKRMESEGKLGLLEYGWPMGGEVVREKTFVYLPLK